MPKGRARKVIARAQQILYLLTNNMNKKGVTLLEIRQRLNLTPTQTRSAIKLLKEMGLVDTKVVHGFTIVYLKNGINSDDIKQAMPFVLERKVLDCICNKILPGEKGNVVRLRPIRVCKCSNNEKECEKARILVAYASVLDSLLSFVGVERERISSGLRYIIPKEKLKELCEKKKQD